MSRHRRLVLALGVAVLLVTGAACGSDSPSSPPAAASDPVGASDDDTGAVADDDLSGALDALENTSLDGFGNALQIALKADRYEIDGDTIHLYLGSNSTTSGEIACVAAMAVVNEGTKVVIHDGGQTFEC